MCDEFLNRKEFDEAADAIRGRTRHQPQVGLILGSGLSPLADEVTQADVVPYSDIPHFPVSGIEGHVGKLVIGGLAGQAVLVMQTQQTPCTKCWWISGSSSNDLILYRLRIFWVFGSVTSAISSQ